MPRGLLPLLLLVLGVGHAGAVDLPVIERTLENGLRVILHEDHSAPVISSYVFFRSGSRDETRGQTGIAHLFEHMMFNGGKRFGPGMFDDLIEGAGGATNGYTSRDLTAYLNNFPREALPLVLDLEADRMGHLAITASNLEQERGIVKEERRLRIDDRIPGVMNEALYLHAFVKSPYRWNTVGFMADLDRITLDEAKAYFRTYYAPNNAIVVLAGDLDPERTFGLVADRFGKFPRREPPAVPDMSEPEQRGERRAVVRRRAELPAVLMGWHGVAATHPDRSALDVAERLLGGGESARLHLDLVREHEVATQVHVDNGWSIAGDLFTLYAKARPERSAAELESRVDAVLADLARKPVPAAELRKAKNQLRADLVRGLKTVSGKANQIGWFAIVLEDPRALATLEPGWEAVGPEDVRRVVGTYLVPARRTVVVLEPQGAER